MTIQSRILESRRIALAILAGAALCAGALLALPAIAADEDTQASVYLVFDPETGEFVTVHDTEGTAQAQETQEAIDSVADVGDGSGAAAPAAAVTGTSPTLIAGLVVAALVLIGGAVAFQRSRA